MSAAQLDWNSVLSEAQKRVRKQQFDTWFSNISLVDLKDDKLLLGVPNAFFRDWLKTNYIDVIKESVKVVTGNNVEIAFRLSPNDPEEDPTVGEAARVQVGQPSYAPESPRPFSRDLASLAREVGLPVHIADEPLFAVARGTAAVLDELDKLAPVLESSRDM